MRRILILAVMLTVAGGMARAAMAEEAGGILGSCINTSNEAICRGIRDTVPEDWRKAHKGDYQGQRNIATCLSTGCDGATIVDEVQGCAWRIVILGSGADIDQTDVSNYRAFCQRRLTRDQQADARLMAGRLFKAIYKRKLNWSPND